MTEVIRAKSRVLAALLVCILFVVVCTLLPFSAASQTESSFIVDRKAK